MGLNDGATITAVGIVDNDPAVRNSLKFSLELEGFSVGVFGGAADLLRAQDLSCFHCFVIDYDMPGMNGLDLVFRLRGLQISAPIILITDSPSKFLVARANRAQVLIVEKPLLGNALLDRINEAIAPKTPPTAN
jgi:two-component system, LuxR family, response regulator FixJ